MNAIPKSPIRILLVDDSELVREGIRAVLANHAGSTICVVGEVGTAADAVTAILQLRPDIVLLDIRLPDASGFEVCRRVFKDAPDTRFVVLTSYSSDSFVHEAVAVGVHGYLKKEIDPAGLVQALHDVANGGTALDPGVASRVMRLLRNGTGSGHPIDVSVLSPQEKRVLASVAQGLTNRQVSEELKLTESTVKNYLVNIFEKLQVKRRTQATALYLKHFGSEKPGEDDNRSIG